MNVESTAIRNWHRSLVGMYFLAGLVFPLSGYAEIELTAHVKRPSALYRTGEEAVFQVQAKEDGKDVSGVNLTVVFSKDGHVPQAPLEVAVTDGKAEVGNSLKEPGFLLMRASYGGKTVFASAGFSPEAIKPSSSAPEDFDEFWTAEKRRSAAVAFAPSVISVEGAPSGVEMFDVKVPSVGAPVSGYYCRPKGARKGSLPIILTLHGAGVSSANKSVAQWVNKGKGMLAMDINAHGIENGQPQEIYKELAQGRLKDYQWFGRRSREEIYFREMFLRVIRAIDFLCAQPEWDGKTLILYGTSQGAFQAIAGGALDERVSYVCAGVPAGCDHTGYEKNRISGWPRFAVIGEDGKPDAASLEAARYYDSVNFAARIRGRGVAFTVGFIDQTCPPTGVYAAYNAIKVDKKIHCDPLVAHKNSPEAIEFLRNAALEHAAKNR